MSPFDNIYTLYEALTDPMTAPVLLAALGRILLAWAALGAALTGLGAALRRLFGGRPTTTFDWLLAFWTGWAVALGLLQVLNLVLPLRAYAFYGLLALGAVGLLAVYRDATAVARRLLRAEWKALAVFGTIAVALAAGAIGPPGEADYALYHNQAILWAQDYPTVPGLGNLHGRLAFNNSVFLYAAAVDAGTGYGTHIAPGLLLLAAAATSLWGARRVLAMDLAPAPLFAALWGPVVAWGASNNEHLRTPDSDFPIVLLGLVTLTALLTVFKPSQDRLKTAYLATAVVMLSAAAVTVKLSAVAFGAAASLLAVWALLRGGRRAAVRAAIWSVSVAAFLALGWLARGTLLSGYPAFPSTFGALPVDWRVACEAAQLEAAYVLSWARQPGLPPSEVLGSFDWVLPWLVRTLRLGPQVFTPMLLTLTALGIGFRRWRRVRRVRVEWAALVAPLVGLAFWLVTAPDPRFAGANIWGLAFGALAVALSEWAAHRPSTVRAVVLVLSVLLSYNYLDTFQTYPPELPNGFVRAAEPNITPVELGSGLVVNMPSARATTDDGDERCYGAPLPCAPTPPDDLQLRGAGALSGGFRVSDPGICD